AASRRAPRPRDGARAEDVGELRGDVADHRGAIVLARADQGVGVDDPLGGDVAVGRDPLDLRGRARGPYAVLLDLVRLDLDRDAEVAGGRLAVGRRAAIDRAVLGPRDERVRELDRGG